MNINRIFKLFFYLLWFIMPFLIYIGISKTFTLVVCISISILILMILTQPNKFIKKKNIAFIKIIFLIILSHTIISLIFHFNFLPKQLGSIIIILYFLLGIFIFVNLFLEIDEKLIHNIMQYSLYIFLLIFILSLIVPLQFNINIFHKSIIPYTEYSLFALFLSPILFYNVFMASKKLKLIIIISGIMIAIILNSLTLITTMLLIIIIQYKLKSIFLIIFGISLIYIFENTDYYIDRINLNKESDNVSTLAYLQGWDFAYNNLKYNYGWGLGLQQMGFINVESEFDDKIQLVTGGESLNLTDGTFNSSKIISEFGVFGLLFILLYLRIFINANKRIRDIVKTDSKNYKHVFILSCIISYFGEFFIRSSNGYFTPTTFVFISSLIIYYTYGYNLKLKNKQ